MFPRNTVTTPTCVKELRYERNPRPDPLPIIHIILPEEAYQQLLLALDPPIEEGPQHGRIPAETHDIAHNDLRAQSPPEEAEIARMPEGGIHPARDQHMFPAPLLLHDVVEALPGLDHGGGADRLAHGRGHQTQQQEHGARVQGRPGAAREQGVGQQALGEGDGVGDGVGRPVGGQEEGLDVGLRGVVGGRGPELEEVEGREGGEEEGNAPERGGGEEQDEDGRDEARCEGEAETEGAQRYA